MDKTRPVCADFFCKQLAAGGNGKDRALSCVCPTCAQDGAANFDLLGTILSEVQSVCSPSQLSRVEQAQFALGTIVRPHYETGEFQRHLLRKCDGSSHCLIHLNSDPSHSVGKGAEKEYPFRQLCYDAAGNVVQHETSCVPCLELDRLAYECEQIILELPIACSGVSSGATAASSGTGNGSAVVSSEANPTVLWSGSVFYVSCFIFLILMLQGDSYGLAGISNHVYAVYLRACHVPSHHPKYGEWVEKLSESLRGTAFIIIPINYSSNDADQDWYLDWMSDLFSNVVIRELAPWVDTCEATWSDGAPNYHNAMSIALLPQMKRLTGIAILSRGFSEPGEGKNKCDALTSVNVRQWVCS